MKGFGALRPDVGVASILNSPTNTPENLLF
jgi:hypothetical protein